MKKLVTAILLASLLLVSCGGGEEKTTEKETAAPDWRNSIEYEGSFYVDKSTKLLYALDTGKITLWDNAGSGSVLQTLKYDTLVSDAIDRMETDDVNGDGFADIRIIYSEKDGESFYNLFLWSKKTGIFSECKDYRFLSNPEISGDGKVPLTLDRGIFGKIECTYVFTNEGIELESFNIPDEIATAGKISAALCPGDVTKGEGAAYFDEVKCPVYPVSVNGTNTAFITCSPDGEWYIDENCKGLYRNVDEKGGEIVRGPYPGTAGAIIDAAEKMLSLTELDIISVEVGKIAGEKATQYTLSKGGFVAVSEGNQWYFSTDGETYCEFISSDAALGKEIDGKFAVEEDETEEETETADEETAEEATEDEIN